MKGLADYFSPPIAISRLSGGGDGMLGGNSLFGDQTLAYPGTGLSNESSVESAASINVQNETGSKSVELSETETLNMSDTTLLGKSGECIASKTALKYITIKVTANGLLL